MEKQLGKISGVNFGIGGYNDSQFGLSLHFSFKGSGVQTFICGGWSFRPKNSKWTEDDRIKSMGEMCIKVCDLMKQAKVKNIQHLIDTPIEATFDGVVLKDWRILEEVI